MLVARPSKTVTAIFRVQMHCLNGATIAILFPILNTRTVSCFIVGLMSDDAVSFCSVIS